MLKRLRANNGGDTLADVVPEHMVCAVCHDVMRDPWMPSCGHPFCRQCLLEWIQTQKNCPLCRSPADGDSLKKADQLVSEMKSFSTKCRNETRGCKWKGGLVAIFEHVKNECEYERHFCPYSECRYSREQMRGYLERRKKSSHISKCKFGAGSSSWSDSKGRVPLNDQTEVRLVDKCNGVNSDFYNELAKVYARNGCVEQALCCYRAAGTERDLVGFRIASVVALAEADAGVLYGMEVVLKSNEHIRTGCFGPSCGVFVDTHVRSVACGTSHYIGLLHGGGVIVRGNNDNCQLGVSNVELIDGMAFPMATMDGVRAVSVFAGDKSSGVVTTNGEVYMWGALAMKPLARRHDEITRRPRQIHEVWGHRVKQVALGFAHLLVLTYDGDVMALGQNAYGQCGQPSRQSLMDPSSQVDEATVILPLRRKGVFKISAGTSHSAALTRDGRLYMFGASSTGQKGELQYDSLCTDPMDEKMFLPTEVKPFTTSKIVDVSCGTFHTVVLDAEGHIFTTGSNTHGQLGFVTSSQSFSIFRQVGNWDGKKSDVVVKRIVAGPSRTVAIDVKGDLYSFGMNTYPPFQHDSHPRKVVNPLGYYVHEGDTTDSSAVFKYTAGSNRYDIVMCSMIDDPLFADGTIKTNDGEKIRVHRGVLACGSTLLAKEKATQVDANYPAMLSFLEYLYGNRVSLDEDILRSVRALAEKYDAQPLVELIDYIYASSSALDEYEGLPAVFSSDRFLQLMEKDAKRGEMFAFVCGDGEEVYVLKCVLRARSQHFEDLFARSPQQMKLHIDNPAKVVREMVGFILTGKLQVIWCSTIEEFIQVALLANSFAIKDCARAVELWLLETCRTGDHVARVRNHPRVSELSFICRQRLTTTAMQEQMDVGSMLERRYSEPGSVHRNGRRRSSVSSVVSSAGSSVRSLVTNSLRSVLRRPSGGARRLPANSM